MPQRVAITGASGLIGGALSAFLAERGDEVVCTGPAAAPAAPTRSSGTRPHGRWTRPTWPA